MPVTCLQVSGCVAVYLANQEFDFRKVNGEMLVFHGGTGETYRLVGLPAFVIGELLENPHGSTLESLASLLVEHELEVPVCRLEEALEQLRKARVLLVRDP